MPEKSNKLERVLEFESEISKVRDIDLLLEKILGEARCFTNADAGSIYIREGDSLKFSYTQNDTLQSQLPSGKKLIYSTFATPINSNSISGHVAVTGQPLNIPDAWEIPQGTPYSFNRSYDELSGYRTRSMLTIPLTSQRGDVAGVLQLINAKDEKGSVIPLLGSNPDKPSNLRVVRSLAARHPQLPQAHFAVAQAAAAAGDDADRKELVALIAKARGLKSGTAALAE